MQLDPFFQGNRKRLFAQMTNDSIAVIPTAPIYQRSNDQEHRFYPDNDFYYLTGFQEPEAVAVLVKSTEHGEQFILFNRRKDPFMEQWVGRRVGQEMAMQGYGADEAYVIDELEHKLPDLMLNKSTLYLTWGRYCKVDRLVKRCLNQVRSKVRAGVHIPDDIVNLEKLISEMRLIKQGYEVDQLRRAGQISVDAHKQALRACRPGNKEYQVHAELVGEFLRQGCQEEAYESIVAAGSNACILHYTENRGELKDGELLLVDAGGKYGFYAADITRTYPINGRFSAEQKAVYEVVLAAQLAAIDKVKAGESWSAMSDAAERVITEGLVELGILSGSVDGLLEQQAFKPYYMHRIGHWMGMDVHDVGRYKVDGQWRDLEVGMVTTVEPGLYFKPGLEIDEKWIGIGIRIEDDLLVTETGHEVLTAGLAKEAEAVEQLVQEACAK